jgi:hypothetical protein
MTTLRKRAVTGESLARCGSALCPAGSLVLLLACFYYASLVFLKQYLAHAMEQLPEDMARCAHEGNTHLKIYVREVLAQVWKEYSMIHHDFRHDVDKVLTSFLRALTRSLQALHLRPPMR